MTRGGLRSRGGPGRGSGARRRGAAAALLSLVALLLCAGPAQAHARLESSDPPAGSVVATAPSSVTLVFTEPIGPGDGAARVYDDHYQPVDSGDAVTVGGTSDRLRVPLQPGLGDGTYVVVWRASSADTHPVTGTFRFSVGAPSVVEGTPPDTSHNDVAGAIMGPLRWLGYAGLVLCPGVLLTLLWLWPEGLTSRRLRRLLVTGAILLGVSTIGSMLVQGAYASGRPLSDLWTSPGTLDTQSRTFDTVHAVRAFLLVGVGGLLVGALSFGPHARARVRRALGTGAALTTVALAMTWPLAGHAAAGSAPALTLALNLMHTLAMVVWLGGLVAVLAGSGESDQHDALGRVLPRFSTTALVCVSALVASGALLAWREVGTVAAIAPTAYGRVLLAKVGGVVVLVALGNLARVWVDRHRSRTDPARPGSGSPEPSERTVDPDAVGSSSLRLGLAGETVVAGGVLALTAALVVIVPARADYVEPWSRVIAADGATVSVELPRPRVGDTVALVSLAAAGSPRTISSVTGSVSRPGAPAAPIRLPLGAEGAAADEATEVGLTFDAAGPWLVRLTLTSTTGSPTTVTFTVPVVADEA